MVEGEAATRAPQSYNYMTWDISTTGRLLCDEFFQMSCVYNKEKYNVYVMPHQNISFRESRKYQVATRNYGLFRYLGNLRTGKIMKTKTEVFALEEFLGWLKKHNDRPIVLITYEIYEFAPYILIQALQRYGMLESFKEVVHGFAPASGLVKKKCKKSMSSLNLYSLAKVLLNKNDVSILDSSCRASLINEILLHLCNVDNSLPAADTLANELMPYVKTITDIQNSFDARKKKIDLKSSLKPIFLPFLKNSDVRQKALELRTYLIRSDLDYEKLNTMWKKGREQFKEDLKTIVKETAGEKFEEDLIAVLTYYFESLENKNAAKPVASIAEIISKLKLE